MSRKTVLPGTATGKMLAERRRLQALRAADPESSRPQTLGGRDYVLAYEKEEQESYRVCLDVSIIKPVKISPLSLFNLIVYDAPTVSILELIE
mgnify:CR=1 FL=1